MSAVTASAARVTAGEGGGGLTVGLFGYYSYRNLGDNLMAYLLAVHVKSLGHRPVVFTKRPADMVRWDVDVVSDPCALTEVADVIVFGGGGLLIPRLHLNEDGSDFNADLGQVLQAAIWRGVPLYGISIGGVGGPLNEIVPRERQTLLRSLQRVTLRNREDLQLLEQAGIDGEFLDDLVWTTAAAFPQKPAQRQRKRVGINLYLGRSRRYRILQVLIALIVKLRQDVDFVFIDNQPGKDGAFQAYRPRSRNANATRSTLVDIEAACRELAALDVLITSRLHVGMVAMSYGVTTVAYAGQTKTRLVYDRIGRANLFWTSRDVIKFVRAFLIPSGLERLKRAAYLPVPEAILAGAGEHYARLTEVLGALTDQSVRAASGAGGRDV